jgi:hypothetical protein
MQASLHRRYLSRLVKLRIAPRHQEEERGALEEEQPDYQSYLLRLWRVGDDEEPTWRALLKSAYTGQQVGFGSLEELFGFLCLRTDQSSSDQIAAQGTGSAAPHRNPSPNPA